MGVLIDFLLDYYIYILIASIIVVLGLIGYIADKTKETKLDKESQSRNTTNPNIPIANIDSNVKLGESVKKMASLDAENVNRQDADMPALKVDETNKQL